MGSLRSRHARHAEAAIDRERELREADQLLADHVACLRVAAGSAFAALNGVLSNPPPIAVDAAVYSRASLSSLLLAIPLGWPGAHGRRLVELHREIAEAYCWAVTAHAEAVRLARGGSRR